MPTPTYELIESVTLAVATGEVDFTSLPQGFRDLVIVESGNFITNGSANNFLVRLNNSTSSIYSGVRMTGNGSTTASGTDSATLFYVGGANNGQDSMMILNLMDYSQTDKHTTILASQDAVASQTFRGALRFGSNDAITSIKFYTANASTIKYDAGTTFNLYGIAG
jgi:hypothetical protein